MRLSLLTRWTALVATLVTVGIVIAQGLSYLLPGRLVLVLALCLLCVLPLAIITIRAQLQHMLSLFRALTGTVTSYQDGDFSFSLHWPQNDELSDLVAAHNALGDVLRQQRLALVQRELLLDTMVQNTPVAMLLISQARAGSDRDHGPASPAGDKAAGADASSKGTGAGTSGEGTGGDAHGKETGDGTSGKGAGADTSGKGAGAGTSGERARADASGKGTGDETSGKGAGNDTSGGGAGADTSGGEAGADTSGGEAGADTSGGEAGADTSGGEAGAAASGAVVYANVAARQLLNQGRKLEGQRLDTILARVSPALAEALARGGDGLFTTGAAGDEEDVYHLARRSFQLNGRRHELLLLRQLTMELRRQEVQTWKKVIRVISHELNNSLAPLTSLAHSGAELVRRGQTERLPHILATIEERTRHLETFILGYARFAKLPAPRLAMQHWAPFLAALGEQIAFRVLAPLPSEPCAFDPAQLEQALLNLIRNAHESGSPADQVTLEVRRQQNVVRIDVRDRGPGMSDTVLTNALVPFYSTKRSGTGLGLALAREIIEAHGGRITLSNREGGGLMVTLML
ncbi:ATP-binding protein [Duganella sp. Leaf126]|uniref:ATP-binding protein n=1 Tax=Duganella sp. Leaf126 TaxID=1736266 RepID=UPI001E2DD075|nr:ATP-binding protein [Duganella sp. Leaf126]